MAQPYLTNDASFISEYKPTPPDVSQLKKKLTPSTRELLESYSEISPSEVESHVEDIVRFIFTFCLCLATSDLLPST
jgi:hypothetical protein